MLCTVWMSNHHERTNNRVKWVPSHDSADANEDFVVSELFQDSEDYVEWESVFCCSGI